MAQVDACLANLAHGDALAKEHRHHDLSAQRRFSPLFPVQRVATRWAHRLQIYVPELWLRRKPRYVYLWLKRAGVSNSMM